MQNKYWYGVGVGLVAVIAVASGVFYWNYAQKHDTTSYGAASINGDSSSATSNAANSGSAGSGSGALGVNSGGAAAYSLGQINPNTSNKNAASGGSTSQNGISSSGSSNGGAPTIDPSTFTQYDKYKPESHAFFADIVPGTGAALASGQTATVVYKGWLTNGQLFDQSKQNNEGKYEAFQFKVGSGDVIPGWDQGLIGTKIGGSRLLIIPPSVGYGEKGQGAIPGNSVLVFQVQLVDAK